MTKAQAAAALLAATAIVAGVVVSETIGSDTVVSTDPQKYDDLKAAGVKMDYAVYVAKDEKGGKIYAATVALSDGGTQTVKLDKSPCARRPAGVKPDLCLALDSDGGTRDQGDENTMQDGQWVGPGCVPTACVVVAGDKPESGS